MCTCATEYPFNHTNHSPDIVGKDISIVFLSKNHIFKHLRCTKELWYLIPEIAV